MYSFFEARVKTVNDIDIGIGDEGKKGNEAQE
jgi:hypothetical protein